MIFRVSNPKAVTEVATSSIEHAESLSLPPPRPIDVDVRFRRLLSACQRGIRDQSLPPIKIHHYLDTLQEQLVDLERSHAIELGFKTLSAYKQHVDEVVTLAPPRPLPPILCRKPPSPPSLLSTLKPPLRPHVNLSDPSNAGEGGERGVLSDPLSESTKQQLDAHEKAQEALTDELVSMAGALKQSVASIQHKVNERGVIANETDVSLSRSLASAKEVAVKAGQHQRHGGGGMCMTLVLLLLVMIVFIIMIVYIKATSFIGYKAKKEL